MRLISTVMIEKTRSPESLKGAFSSQKMALHQRVAICDPLTMKSSHTCSKLHKTLYWCQKYTDDGCGSLLRVNEVHLGYPDIAH